MELTIKERLSLSYQLKIIEKLYPEEADYYASHRKAIEEGYELHYNWISEHLYEGLKKEECKEVLDILDMYSNLYFSFRELKNPKNLTISQIVFPGFDGNNETMRMAYTRYFIEDLQRFETIKKLTKGNYNSHIQYLNKYRKMLLKLNSYPLEKRNSLTEDQIIDLIQTKSY